MRVATSALFAAVVCAAAPAQEPPLSLSVTCPQVELELGKGVPIQIVCAWSKDLIAEPLDTSVWRPLVLTELRSEVREEATRFVRTHELRCQVFTRDSSRLPPLSFRARRASGEILEATAAAPAFVVKPAAESRPTGPPETPSEFFEAKPPSRLVPLGAGLALVLIGVWTWQGRRTGRWPWSLAAVRAADPRAVALGRLDALAAKAPTTHAELSAYYLAATDALRGWLEAGLHVGAPHLTSEELVASAAGTPALAAPLRDRLSSLLEHCDLVKFAREVPTATQREAMLAAARTIVTA